MSRTLRRIGVALGGVVALIALLLVGAEVWGRRWLVRYAETWRAEIAAERQRVAAMRMPVLRGEPLEENVVPRYQPVLQSMKRAVEGNSALYREELQGAVGAGPGSAPTPEVAGLLEAHRTEIDALREALRCTRSDWQVRYEDGFGAEVPPLFPARVLAHLVIVDGHERARAGDLQGAAERYLDVARFGADFGTGSLIEVLVGIGMDDPALEALGRLVTSFDPSQPVLAGIQAELAKLEGYLPSIPHGIRMERLALGWLSAPNRPVAAGDLGLPEGPIGWVTPRRALYAHGLARIDPVLRALEAAMAAESREERGRLLAEVDDTITTSWNPLVNMAVPSFTRAHVSYLDLLARYRLVRLALEVEQAHGADGSYPAEGAGLDVPADPHAAPAALRYQAADDGRGYRLWSVGRDGKDDGGKAEGDADVVLERRPVPR